MPDHHVRHEGYEDSTTKHVHCWRMTQETRNT
jgi:hypothetical protein